MTADAVLELFATEEARERHPDLSAAASLISNKDAAALSETITPQGLVAVCRRVDVRLAEALDGARLVVALVEPNDPGNAGAIVRSADAAGADTIVIAGGVDIYNGKAIRASAGSVFHLRLVVDVDVQTVLDAAGELTTLAATARSLAPRCGCSAARPVVYRPQLSRRPIARCACRSTEARRASTSRRPPRSASTRALAPSASSQPARPHINHKPLSRSTVTFADARCTCPGSSSRWVMNAVALFGSSIRTCDKCREKARS